MAHNDGPWGAMPAPDRKPIETPDSRWMRRMLGYAVLHAERMHDGAETMLRMMARDPLIGPDHPVYVQARDSLLANWKLTPALVETALGRKLAPGESMYDGLRVVARMVADGIG